MAEMRPIYFKVKLGGDPRDPIERMRTRLSLIALGDALIDVNMLHIFSAMERGRPYPMLYDCNGQGDMPLVRYHEEEEAEEWCDIPTIIEQGWGDCEDLMAWRAAEKRVYDGIDAEPKLKWKFNRELRKYTYHLLVGLPNGEEEDPSRVMGMGTASARLPLNEFKRIVLRR